MSEKTFSRTTARATALLVGALLASTFAAGFAHASTVTSGYDTSNGTGTLGPAAPGNAITRAQIIARADDWMNAQVPYSQTEGWEDSATGGPYRMDCSGFVSMAWGLSTSLVTSTLPSVATVTDSNITGDTNLSSGDALDYTADHVVLFDHWTDSSGDFAYDAEHTTGQVTNQSTDNIDSSTLEGYAMSDFEALRYNNLSTTPAPTQGDVYDNTLLTSGSWSGVTTVDGGGHVTYTASVGLPGGSMELFTLSSGNVWENNLSNGTWGGAKEIDGNGSITAMAAAVLPNGTVHLDTIAPGGVYDNTQTTAGGSWGAAKVVDGNSTIKDIALAGLSNGVLHLVTLSSGGVYDNSLSTSGTWSGAVGVDSNSSITKVAAAAVGTTLHLETLSSGGVFDNSLTNGGSWGGAKGVDGNSSITQIALATTGTTLRLVTIANGGVYNNALPSGGSWGGAKLVDSNSSIFSISVAGMPDGTMHLQTIAY